MDWTPPRGNSTGRLGRAQKTLGTRRGSGQETLMGLVLVYHGGASSRCSERPVAPPGRLSI